MSDALLTRIETATPKAESHSPSDSLSQSNHFNLQWLALAHAPFWLIYCIRHWERQHYQFTGLAVIAAYYYLYRALLEPRPTDTPVRRLHLPLLWVGVGVLLAAFLMHSYWLMPVGLLIQVFAVAYERFGWRCLRICLPTFGLLALCIPPPFGYDYLILKSFQDLSTYLSCRVMDRFDMPYLRSGNIIDIPQRQLFVAEACSGVSFFFATLCCVFLWAGLYKLWTIETLLLFLIAPIWIIFGNVLRVMIVVVTSANNMVDLAGGWKHDALGLFTFAICLFLTFNTRQLFLIAFPRIRKARPVAAKVATSPNAATAPIQNPVPPSKPELPYFPIRHATGVKLAACVVAILVAFCALYSQDFLTSRIGDPHEVISKLESLDKTALDVPIPGWKLQQFARPDPRPMDSIFGERSATWQGSVRDYRVTASADYPFEIWHDVTICYIGTGWNILEKKDLPPTTEIPMSVRQARLERRGNHKAYLVFVQLDSQGEPIAPSEIQPQLSFGGQIVSRFRSWVGEPDPKVNRPREPQRVYVQIQVLLSGSSEPDEQTRKCTLELLNTLAKAAKAKLK